MIPRWLSAWLRKPFKVNGGPFSARRAYGLPSAEEHEAQNAMFRNALAAMDTPAKPTASEDELRAVMVAQHQQWLMMEAGADFYADKASDAARTLSRHGHAKARAKIRAKADEMNAAMGRPKVVWP